MRPAAAYQADPGEEPQEQEQKPEHHEAQGNYADEEAYDYEYNLKPR